MNAVDTKQNSNPCTLRTLGVVDRTCIETRVMCGHLGQSHFTKNFTLAF